MMDVRTETTLSDLIAQRLATLGITQVDYATRLGVERSVLHNILSGKAKLPKEPFRRRLAADLGITVLDIFLMAGELRPEDIPGAVGTTVRPDRSAALCRLVDQVDWSHGDRYEDVTGLLDAMRRRDRARKATPAPHPPSGERAR